MKKVIFLLFVLTCSVKSQWIQYPSGNFGGPLYFVNFDNTTRGYFGGHCSSPADVIYRTYDGGPSGVVIHTPTTNSYYDFFFFSSSSFFLVGSQRCIVRFNSGWSTQLFGTGNYYSISAPSVNTIYVVGDSPNNVNKSTNGGNNWSALTSPTTNTLKGVYFADESTGWICGLSGVLYKTSNGGASWINQSQSASINFEKILFINSSTGIVVGSGGSIFKTSNGGSSWISKQSNLTTKLNSLCFYTPNLFWSAGDAGKIVRSSNTGETWFTQNTNNAVVTFNDICFPSSETGYAVASEGVMYKTTNSGGVTFIQPVSNEIPNQFSLSQNYPNPFNPSTKIKFALPEGSFATLVVYDILGREAAIIVSEQLNAGTYEVEWNASNYPSGVYYYKLSSGDFTETRKMILIK